MKYDGLRKLVLKPSWKNYLKLLEFTDPVSIPGGFIILKINDLKNEKITLNLEEELNKTINAKINAQLSQFSNIYLNKIKNDVLINEK